MGAGTCAGADDLCHGGHYERLPGTYKISNSRWPEYYIKMGRWSGSALTKDDGEETEFYISVVHGPPNAGLAVLLVSAKWPDHALAMEEHEYHTSSGVRRRRKLSTEEYHTLDDQRLDDHADVGDAASLLLTPPVSNPNPNATMVMIRGIDEDEFAYSQKWSNQIRGDDDDEGAGMYWYITPALPESLTQSMHPYTGERCHFDCGTPDLIANGATHLQCHSWYLIQATMTIAMLLVSVRSKS